MIRNYLALLLLCLLEVAFQCYQIWTDPVDTLASPTALLAATAYLPLLVLTLASLLLYRRWQRRAEAAVEAGLPPAGPAGARGLGILVLMWSGLLIAGLFASISRSTGMVILTIGMVLFFALVYFLANAARKALQRLRCPPWANLLVIVGICIAMFAGGTTGLFALMIRNAGSGWLEDHPPVETYTAHGMTWSVYADPIPRWRTWSISTMTAGPRRRMWSGPPWPPTGEYRQDARLGTETCRSCAMRSSR